MPTPTPVTETVPRPAAARRSAARTSSAMPPFDAMEREQAEQIVQIPLDKLHNHPGNPEPTEPEIVSMMTWLSDEGQQEPITVRELPEPIGHYQVLAGKTRLAAARRLGWDALEARVRSDLADEAAAIRFAATNNSLRRSETTLRQARWVAYLVEQGRSIEDAGQMFGWSRSHATNMLGLLKLPEPWLSRVASGEIPPTVACRLNPYAAIPELLKAFDKDYRMDPRVAAQWKNKDIIGARIGQVLANVTRPMDKGKHNYGWSLGHDHPRYFHEDDALKDLRCVELPIGKNGALQRVALNVTEYDRLNLPQIHKRLEEQKSKAKGKTKGKATPSTPAAIAAEAKRKRKEQDEQLAKWIKDTWRPAFLRLCCSESVRALPPGEHWRFQALLPRLIEACWYGMGGTLYEFEAVAAGAWQENGEYRTDTDRWRIEHTLATIRQDDDPISDVEERQRLHVALLLWPQDERVADHKWIRSITADSPFGRRLPPLSTPAIEAIAELVNIPINGRKLANIREGWIQSGRPSKQRDLVQQLLERHTRDQLDDLAAELCAGRSCPGGLLPATTWIRESKTKGEQVSKLLELHTAKEPLPVPNFPGDVKAKVRKKGK